MKEVGLKILNRLQIILIEQPQIFTNDNEKIKIFKEYHENEIMKVTSAEENCAQKFEINISGKAWRVTSQII